MFTNASLRAGAPDRHLDVCLTFDNLGEAADIEYGLWPADAPIGRHLSATEGIPAVLRILHDHGVKATFFVEGWNADRYPETISALHAAGHEVGFHGWRHENWSALDTTAAKQLAMRSLDALRQLVPTCTGLRPPGGALTREVCAMLSGLGIDYVSPLGDAVSTDGAVAILPFAWKAVDALYFEPTMSDLRHSLLGRFDPCPDRDWRLALEAVLHDAAARGGVLTVIFHPYLLARQPERIAVLDWFVRSCAENPSISLRRAADVAEALRTLQVQHD